MAWTKIDIKAMKQALSTAYLKCRAFDVRDREAQRDKFLTVLEPAVRTLVVISGIAELMVMFEGRAKENDGAADHFTKHPNVYGKATPEMIERFRGLAGEARKAAAKAKKLIDKINAEGLPQEVLEYDPTNPRG